MDCNSIKAGMRVVVTRLESTTGMTIAPVNLENRRLGATGKVKHHVPGLGGDVWFIEHDDSPMPGEVAAYCVTEIEPVS